MDYTTSGFDENLMRPGELTAEPNVQYDSANIGELFGAGALPVESIGVLATAIDQNGNWINELISSSLNSQTKEILGEYIFSGSGALAINTDANNGLWISPTGILGKKAGATTFALDIAGNATFSGSVTASTITGGTIRGADIYASSDLTHSDVHLTTTMPTGYAGGMIEFLYNNTQTGFMASANTGRLVIESISQGFQLTGHGTDTCFINSGESMNVNYNVGGGTGTFIIGNEGTTVMELNDSNQAYFAGQVYAAGYIYTGTAFVSADGTVGTSGNSIQFVTDVGYDPKPPGVGNYFKYRSITFKNGIVTSIGSQSGMVPW